MPFLAGNLIRVVLLLALAFFLGSLLLVAAAMARRFKRERDFKVLDAFRERSHSVLEGLSAGALEYGSGLEQFHEIMAACGVQDIESILVERLAQPRYAPVAGRLLGDLGMIESWQHRAGAAVRPMGGRAALPLFAWGARFYHRARDVQKLGRLVDQQSWRLLVKALDDPHEDVREAAVRSLAAIRVPQSFPVLVKQLQDSLALPTPVLSSRILRLALGQFPLELADQLRPLLENSSFQAQLAGAQALREMLTNHSTDHSGSENLSAGLSDLIWKKLASVDSPDVRAVAADLMAFMGDEESGTKLIHSAGDKEWFVRLHAVRALGKRKNPAHRSVVADHLTDPHWRVREAAALALAAAGSEGASELLRVFAATEDTYAREQIAEALVTSGLMDELARRCSGEGALPEREALLEVVRMGKTACLESWLRHQPATQREKFLATLRCCNDSLVQKWIDAVAG
ncbi:MAG: HEAT repeat domain-containing protein [Terriglobia bacterium]